MADIKFAEGMTCRVPTEKAEGFGLVTRICFNVEKFYEWAKENQDERGWVNVGIWKSKKTHDHYPSLDTWKPEKKEESPAEAVDPDAVIGF